MKKHPLLRLDVLRPVWQANRRYATQDNWVTCRQCSATAAHVRDLVHEPDCLSLRVWRDGAWHWMPPGP